MSSRYAGPSSSTVGLLARRGAIWSFGMIVSRQIISIGGTSILARLLSPSDYGLIGLVATLTALLQSFSEMGLSWATIQRKDITVEQIHNFFWINSGIGILLWLFCIVLSPAVGDFYGHPEVRAIVIALGATFAISGIAVQPTALIKRQMKFSDLSKIVIFATLVGVLAAVAAAVAGFGYWSLVIQMLVVQIVRLILVFAVTKYRPRRPHFNVEMLGLVRFGGYMALTGVLIYVAENLDNVIVGKVRGTTDLGFYSRAYFLMMLPTLLATDTLTSIMVPSLASLSDDRGRMGAAYRKAVAMTAFIGFPASLGLALTAHGMVRVIYGSAWMPVAPILVAMSAMSMAQPIKDTSAWLFIACGKGRAYAIWSSLSSAALVSGFAIGIHWGPIGVATASSVVACVIVVPTLYISHHAAGISLGPTVAVLARPFVASLAMGLAVVVTTWIAKPMDLGLINTLVLQIAVGALTYLGALFLFLKPKGMMEILPSTFATFRRGVS